MLTAEAEKAQKDSQVARAEQYRTMMELSAWKDFSKQMDSVFEQATKDEDAMPIADLGLAKIGECRGRRNAITKLKKHIDYVLAGIV